MVFVELLDPVLGPLLATGPLWAITILAFAITFLITISYKFLTDQDEMKRLKTKMKEYQKKIKEMQKKDPQKALKMQQGAMEDNLKYMKHSFRPTLYTFIPIIIIFGWMNANLVYEPLMPGDVFEVIAELEPGLEDSVELYAIPELVIKEPVKTSAESVSWRVTAKGGDYKLIVKYAGEEAGKDIVAGNYRYEPVSAKFEGPVKSLTTNLERFRLNFSLLGWRPGWLGTYILLSIIISTVLRKIMRIY